MLSAFRKTCGCRPGDEHLPGCRANQSPMSPEEREALDAWFAPRVLALADLLAEAWLKEGTA